jgi:hypothetical protein
MSTGLIGNADLLANTDTALGAAVGENMIVNVMMVNRGGADVTARIAITSGGAPTAAEWIEYGATIPANGGVMERTGLALSQGERVYVRASAATVSARAHGIPAA